MSMSTVISNLRLCFFPKKSVMERKKILKKNDFFLFNCDIKILKKIKHKINYLKFYIF